MKNVSIRKYINYVLVLITANILNLPTNAVSETSYNLLHIISYTFILVRDQEQGQT